MGNSISENIDVQMREMGEWLVMARNRDLVRDICNLKYDGHSVTEIAKITNSSEEDVRYLLDIVRKHIDIIKSKK